MSEKCLYLNALLYDAEEVHPVWRFDEQQADPIHSHWYWEKAKKELQALLASQQGQLSRPDKIGG